MAKVNRNLFKIKDLIYVGPAIAASLLCLILLFFIKGQLLGSIVTGTTGIFILLIIAYSYLIRYLFTKPTYITKHGIHVVWGKRNKPSKRDFEKWTQDTINHFANADIRRLDNEELLTRQDITEALMNVKCYFADTPIVRSIWLWVRGIKKEIKFLGLSRDNIDIYVGYWEDGDGNPSDLIRLVTKHELGHPLLGLNSFPSGSGFGDAHHEMYNITQFDCA